MFLCSLFACETIICTNYITKHFRTNKKYTFSFKEKNTHRAFECRIRKYISFSFFQMAVQRTFRQRFFKKNVCFQETNEMEWGRKKKRKTLKGFECVCARCNVTNLELMTINSYFNSNALIQLKLKST